MKLEDLEEEEHVDEEDEDSHIPVQVEEKFRTIGLFGEINEELASEIVFGLHALALDKNEEKPIELMVSTPGGHAADMFAIYDILRLHREEQIIETYGLGKVMSAGVLILAAGSPGHRKIGKHCRIMIHQCSAGNMGSVSTLENEMKEIKILQEQYLEALASEIKLTLKQLKQLIRKNQNVYFSATQAVEYGIADIIV